MDTRPLVKKAVDICGSQVELARRIGGNVKQPHIWLWLNKTKRLPAERAVQIERATGGRITRHDLRPDLFGPPANDTTEQSS